MPAKFFISYRRDDSAGYAGRIHDRLEREFGRDLLFMDVDAIPLGVNFVKALTDEVAKCDVLLAVIGPNWMTCVESDGTRRLDNERDFVRIEIAAALARNIPVIPILLERTRMPDSTYLPKDIKELALRNGIEIRHASFHDDMNKLIRGLRHSEPAIATGQDAARNPDQVYPIGSTLDSPEVIALIERTANPNTRRTYSDCFYLSSKSSGVSLRFDFKNELTHVFLYSGRSDGYSQYKSRLPKGITFDDTRSQVQRKCGVAHSIEGNEIINCRDEYEGFSVSYVSKDASDMTIKIAHVAVM